MRKTLWSCLGAIVLALAAGTMVWAAPGKFYIVGTGTAPDLITLRAREVAEKADIFLVHEPPGRDAWKDLIGDREVWVQQHTIYALLGVDPADVKDPGDRELVLTYDQERQAVIDRIAKEVKAGKTVVCLHDDDPMVFENIFYLEMLPRDVPTEVVPGVGVMQAACATLQKSPVYGWDTSSVVLTMADWEGRTDGNEQLMALQTSMVFYTMLMDYPLIFDQLKRHYPAETPVAVVCYPGDPVRERIIKSTVGRFIEATDVGKLPPDRNLLLVGNFLETGQARKDGLAGGKQFIMRDETPQPAPEPAAAAAPSPARGTGKGKLYIVGMGLTRDLITVRAVRALEEADILILQDPEAQDVWKEYTAGKEVWTSPRSVTIYMGVDPDTLADPEARRQAIENGQFRQRLAEWIAQAVRGGRTVAVLEGGDPMMYGNIYYPEILPSDIPCEIVPGVGAFQAATAAVKRSPCYGWDTSSTIITMSDWPGRADLNEKLMAFKTSMVFYTMHLDYNRLFQELGRHYAPDTPVAVVCYAADREREQVIRSTVGRFLSEVPLNDLPRDRHMLLVGKFLETGQARKDGLMSVKRFMDRIRSLNATGTIGQ